jgi:chemotaxis protein MotB
MRRAAIIVLFVASSGCVSQQRFDQAVADATSAHKSLDEATGRAEAGEARAQTDEAELAKLREQIEQAKAKSDADDQEITKLKLDNHNVGASLDEQTAIGQQLRGELTRLGKNVDQLLSDKGTLSKSLDEAKQRLDELRRAQAAADARTALFRELALRFKRMTDTGELSVALRAGRIMLVLPNDVLFDSGRSELTQPGKATLLKIAQVLRDLGDRQLQVAGHTDNVPIHTARFATNWELSTARALEVVKLLVESGVPPRALSAAGYGEFDPVAPNDTAANKSKNRRIEITLFPKIDELPAVPDLKG